MTMQEITKLYIGIYFSGLKPWQLLVLAAGRQQQMVGTSKAYLYNKQTNKKPWWKEKAKCPKFDHINTNVYRWWNEGLPWFIRDARQSRQPANPSCAWCAPQTRTPRPSSGLWWHDPFLLLKMERIGDIYFTRDLITLCSNSHDHGESELWRMASKRLSIRSERDKVKTIWCEDR